MDLRIHVWNVGHGEAIRIDFSDSTSVIRDFGQSSEQHDETSNKLAVAEVYEGGLLPSDRKVDAILSHAHRDHFSGYQWIYDEGLRGVFGTAYIPWLKFDTQQSLGWKASLLNSYCLAYSGPSGSYKAGAEYWLRAAPIMRALSKRLIGVCAGAHICRKRVCRVLWPPPPTDDELHYAIEGALLDLGIRTVEASLRSVGAGSAIRRVRTRTKHIVTILSKYHTKHPDIGPYGYEAPFGEKPRKREPLGRIPTLRECSKDDEALRDICWDLCATRMPRTNPRIRSAFSIGAERISHFIDEHSIVFEIPGRGLFLSDLSDHSMDRMAAAYLRSGKRYRLVKSAHHGTRFGHGVLGAKVLAADTILHCCGPGHPNCGPPVKDYEEFIRGGRRRVYCTDWNFDKWGACPKRYKLFRSAHRKF